MVKVDTSFVDTPIIIILLHNTALNKVIYATLINPYGFKFNKSLVAERVLFMLELF